MILAILAGALLVPVLQVGFLRFVDPPFTMMMLYQRLTATGNAPSSGWRYDPRPLAEISPWLQKAALAAEDQRFFSHSGFDLTEIAAARESVKRKPGKALRGASTITQQLAKNLFLPPWRSFFRKGVEAYYTLLMELLWPKKRILEVYLNVAQFGPEVYGAEAAARFHFRKHAGGLSPEEASRLAAVLPNPVRWSASRPTPYIVKRSAWIQSQLTGIKLEEPPRR